MSNVNIYFSDFFNVKEKVIDEYGAINISLINDLPLFVDPFLLFSSEDKKLKKIHDEMISYLKFLQLKSEQTDKLSGGMLKSWFMFSEVKQTWLGFSLSGNAGRGLGLDFAKGLFKGFKTVFKSFSKEAILQEAHMEKLCLISDKVGKDKISDFTTNFCKQYLLEYTERFAKDNEEEYYLKNICNIRYCYEQTWDNKKALVYFVGPKRSSLQQSVHNGCVIRKVYSDNELPDTKKFFPLMSVEFVRNEQYTVIPFPFKYLREYSE